MARAKTPSPKAKTATPPALGLGLGLDEPLAPTALAAGPLRSPVEPETTAPAAVSVEVKIPAMVRPEAAMAPAVFSVVVNETGWAVEGQIPGCEATQLAGTEAPEVTHGPWVHGCIKAMREVTFANFQGPVEIRIAEAAVVGFLRVTLPSYERAYRNFKDHAEAKPQKCLFPRPFREFLMLYLRLHPRILWV